MAEQNRTLKKDIPVMSREEINNKERGIDETGSRRFWVVKPNIDVERVLALDEVWMKQMWAQVYETLYMPDPQGFRLTKEEMADLQAHNEAYAKPLRCGAEDVVIRRCGVGPMMGTDYGLLTGEQIGAVSAGMSDSIALLTGSRIAA